MVTALLHEICVDRLTFYVFLTDEPVAKVLEKVFKRGVKADQIDWIKTREITLTTDKPKTAAHEISKFL